MPKKTKTVECEECSGHGTVDCYDCDGTGYEPTTADVTEEADACCTCSGDGYIDCENCDGLGEVEVDCKL